MIRHLSDERIDIALRQRRPGERYPRIESVRVIQKMDTPSAIIKVRRRAWVTGGPAVVRTYFVYSLRWLARWQRAQRALFKKES